MGHLHSVYDTDNHFKVNGITRQITDISKSKTSVVQYDHNSERFTFEIPRYIEGHDMLKCNAVSVRYENGNVRGKYKVGDFQVSPADENVVICSWLISQNATRYFGALNFQLWFECITETDPDYVWKTRIYTGITVQEAIADFDVEEEGEWIDYPDEPDDSEKKKLNSPVISLYVDSGSEEPGEPGERTPAILGVAVLGRTILGATESNMQKLATPIIKLYTVSDSAEQLEAPVIELVEESDENPIEPAKLDAPFIELVGEADQEEPEEPDDPVATKLATPTITVETVDDEVPSEPTEPEEPDVPEQLTAPVIELYVEEEPEPEPEPVRLATPYVYLALPAPTNLSINKYGTLSWDDVPNAQSYLITVIGVTSTWTSKSESGINVVSLPTLLNKYGAGTYQIYVQAHAKESSLASLSTSEYSEPSEIIEYTIE